MGHFLKLVMLRQDLLFSMLNCCNSMALGSFEGRVINDSIRVEG